MAPCPHFILIGGFLGAGKTTAVARLARYLADQGLRVGLITNDQAKNLVDTARLRAEGHATEEIAGGCFCCHFDALVDATGRLCADENPDVFIAEAVGSCADLVATVTRPLQRIHGQRFSLAPLSVLVDPTLGRRVFGLDGGSRFSADVDYVFSKQLEEAEVIVINKCDLLEPAAIDELRAALRRRFPLVEIMTLSARENQHLEPWFRRVVFGRETPRPAIDLDYDRYASGEARLGWFNAVVDVRSASAFDPNAALLHLGATLQAALRARGVEIAHLKMTLQQTDTANVGLAAVNVVSNTAAVRLAATLDGLVAHAKLLINLRAEAPPEALAHAVRRVLAGWAAGSLALETRLEQVECFQPARPHPTHRDPGPVVAPSPHPQDDHRKEQRRVPT